MEYTILVKSLVIVLLDDKELTDETFLIWA
jgi:hypothetical protein